MEDSISLRVYKNATTAKMNNSRVQVVLLEDETVGIGFKRYSPEDANEPRAKHQVIKDKIVVTNLRISRTCAMALLASLHEMLYREE